MSENMFRQYLGPHKREGMQGVSERGGGKKGDWTRMEVKNCTIASVSMHLLLPSVPVSGWVVLV